MNAKTLAVTESNASAIESVLLVANGKSTAHAFTTYAEVARIAKQAEAEIETLSIAKARRAGARYHAVSGDTMPNAYKYSREGTSVSLVRKSTGWHLASASRVTLYKEGGRWNLSLTRAQADEAIANFSKNFSVQQAPQA